MTAIRAGGDYHAEIDDAAEQPPELKALVTEAIGEPVRRIGRFIQLALIGAGRCVGGQQLPADTGVYLSSGRGDLEVTLDVMEQLFRHGQPPKPLTFINSVSNSACFYIARQFRLTGPSSFVCNRYFGFESALQLALDDLAAGTVRSALVGSVDVVVAPLADHRRRLALDSGAPLAEGSHWLWLTTADGPPGLAVQHCADRATLLAWIAAQELESGSCHLSGGQFLESADLEAIAAATGIARRFDYRAGRGYYDTHAGAALGEFRRAYPAGQLLHVNGDADGRYSAMLWRHR